MYWGGGISTPMAKFISLYRRILCYIIALLIFGTASGARAVEVDFHGDYCFAITDLGYSAKAAPSLNFRCKDNPKNYQKRSLWVKWDNGGSHILPDDVSVMVHQSRFDALSVGFLYQDGQSRWQRVENGNFGAHWRIGGQIKFDAPDRGEALTAVILRFDNMTDHGLLRVRIMPQSRASQESGTVAAIVSGAGMLLLISFFYSTSFAWAARKPQLLWQASWSGVMIIWGLTWTQAHLLIFPSLAGAWSAQAATLLATSAIALAVFAAVQPLPIGAIPKWLRHINLGIAVYIASAGIPLTLIRDRPIVWMDQILGLTVVVNLLLVAAALLIAWHKGYRQGRDMLIAWSVPMVVLIMISLVNIDNQIWGGGAKLVVLVASSWLAIWLTVTATGRVNILRRALDAARRETVEAKHLALKDPLTGLNNRRGFQEAVEILLGKARVQGLPTALLLVDIDRFKSVNDQFGHEAGDIVLCSVASRLAQREGSHCTVARVGGEEFALFLIGVEGLVLRRFADEIRRSVAECDLGDRAEKMPVTASVGVAFTRRGGDYPSLYREADRALYAAKDAGRDRVSVVPCEVQIWSESGEGLALNHDG